ncbi:MAG TPA: hypothetical protein VJB41_01090 [Patescibacteria group bacterium]|nr:hypothetical protein [Patescibacteria group bacterium]
MTTLNSESEQLIQKLKNNSEQILIELKRRKNDVNKYIFLKIKFSEGCNIENNIEFENTYKAFYVMRTAGLTDEYFKKYFKLLNTRNFGNQNKLTDFLTKMDGMLTRQKHNSIQLSFATKALHTINNDLPIYDVHVGNFFQLKNPNDTKLPMQNRIATRQKIYDELITKFNNLLSLDETKKYLGGIRSMLNSADVINDTKLLDFIIWLYGSATKHAKK